MRAFAITKAIRFCREPKAVLSIDVPTGGLKRPATGETCEPARGITLLILGGSERFRELNDAASVIRMRRGTNEALLQLSLGRSNRFWHDSARFSHAQYKKGGTGAKQLRNGDLFPEYEVRTADGRTLHLPRDLAGEFSVLLFYRGGW